MKAILVLSLLLMPGLVTCLAQTIVTGDPVQGETAPKEAVVHGQKVLLHQLGDKTIAIPAPEGFEEITSQAEFMRDYYRNTEGVVNDLLGVYYPSETVKKILRREPGDFTLSTKVSVLKKGRAREVSREGFNRIVADFESRSGKIFDLNSPEMKAIRERIEKGSSSVLGKDVKVEFAQPLNLGSFDRPPETHNILLLWKSRASMAGDESKDAPEIPELIAGSLVLVKQRVLFVYTHKILRSSTDLKTEIEAHKAFTRRWINQIIAANRE
jgi:hypothetical protein